MTEITTGAVSDLQPVFSLLTLTFDLLSPETRRLSNVTDRDYPSP